MSFNYQLKEEIDIFISHDWPRGVYNYADTRELLHWKPFFRFEIVFPNCFKTQFNLQISFFPLPVMR
jgi:lariat debranching enzyme